MKYIIRFTTWASLTILSILFLMTLTIFAKELPLLVDVSALGKEHDHQRVALMGWAQSAEMIRGKMGSTFVKTEVGKGKDTVTVFSFFPSMNILNNKVIVQGMYHHEGRFGGLHATHYVVADAIVRDW
ncbi:MAG: hypothetical protein ACE5GK_10800 [Nitrospiria bacterium]